MAAVLLGKLSLLRVIRRHGIRGLREARARRRLAGAVRRRAHDEREHFHRGGVIEFDSIARRTALYERIAQRLEDLDRPVAEPGVGRLERLLVEPPPFRDYGRAAKERNARIESVLGDLERARADIGPNENHAATHDGRAGAFETGRSQRVGK